jgi:hypothetical protein
VHRALLATRSATTRPSGQSCAHPIALQKDWPRNVNDNPLGGLGQWLERVAAGEGGRRYNKIRVSYAQPPMRSTIPAVGRLGVPRSDLRAIMALALFAACGRSHLYTSAPSPTAGSSGRSDVPPQAGRAADQKGMPAAGSAAGSHAGGTGGGPGLPTCAAPLPTGLCVEHEDNFFDYSEGRRVILEGSAVQAPHPVFDSIGIRALEPDGGYWHFDFSPVAGDFWNTGVFDPAESYLSMRPGYAGFDVRTGFGRSGCVARFEITELAFTGGGGLDRFAATFEEQCEEPTYDTMPRLWGSVNIHASGVPDPPREHPEQCIVPGASGICLVAATGSLSGIPRHLAFSDADGPLAVTFADDVLTAEFDPPDPFLPWLLRFGIGDCPGAPPTPRFGSNSDLPPPGRALLRTQASCGDDVGSFEVLELRCEPTLEVPVAAIDFVHQCAFNYVLHGKLRFNSDLP